MHELNKINLDKIQKRIYRNHIFSEFFIHYYNLGGNCVWAGGSFRHLFDKEEKINDFDLFFVGDKPDEQLANARKYFASKYRGGRFILTYECPENKLFSYKDNSSGIKIQLIDDAKYNSTEDVLNSFDFNCCRFAIQNNEFYYNKQGIKDIRKKELSLFDLSYPVATINRLIKYKKYGYSTNNCLKDIVKVLNSDKIFKEEDLERVYID